MRIPNLQRKLQSNFSPWIVAWDHFVWTHCVKHMLLYNGNTPKQTIKSSPMVYFSGGTDRKEKFAASSFKDFLNMDETLHEIARKLKKLGRYKEGGGGDLDHK
jgi:hypothetical protein